MGIQRVKEEMHQVQPPVVIFVASHGTSRTYGNEVMNQWVIRLHKGDCFNENGTFTTPREGIYQFDYHNNHTDADSGAQYIDWYLNGAALGYGRIYNTHVGGWSNMSGHLIIELSQGDTIQLVGQANINPDGSAYGLWSGYLM